MFGVFFKVLFSIITSIANLFLTPINTLVMNNFPNIAILVNNFNNFVNTYIGGSLGFFGALLPPITKNVILFYLSYQIVRFVVVVNAHLLIKVFTIIKNIKIW